MQDFKNLPPLNGLRAFITTARTGSITKAADHLSVTSGAVSHQIKSLEQAIKVKLFTRTNNTIALTKAGQKYLDATGPALDSIASATKKLNQKNDHVKIAAPTSLAAGWLIPRLDQFHAIAPHIRIDLTTLHHTKAQPDQDVDITLNYQRDIPASDTILANDHSIPIATASLIGKKKPETAQEIAKYPLIAATKDSWEWQQWAETHDIPFSNLNFAGFFDTDDSAILACAAGLGICLMPRILTDRRWLKDIFIELEKPNHLYGYFTMEITGSSQPNVKRFASWLRKETSHFR